MGEEKDTSTSCFGCLTAIAILFVAGFGIYILVAVFSSPGGILGSIGFFVLLGIFIVCLKFFSGGFHSNN